MINATDADKNKEWIGVDLDGTLATFDLELWAADTNYIGKPIAPMVERVQRWIRDGKKVKIFTARVGTGAGWSDLSQASDDDFQWIENQRRLVQAWTLTHIGTQLEVTATKDWAMRELWDDRAIQVVNNRGHAVVEIWREMFMDVVKNLGEEHGG